MAIFLLKVTVTTAYEAVVFRHLREYRDRKHRDGEEIVLHYFRSDQSAEVDFVVDLPGHRVGVEVKSGVRPRRGLRKSKRTSQIPGCTRLLVLQDGRGGEQVGEGVEILSLSTLLLNTQDCLER